MEQTGVIQSALDKPVFSPTYFNIEYLFAKIVDVLGPIGDFITNPKMWATLGVISSLISLFAIGIIIFSLVRMREIQIHEKKEIDHEIALAALRRQEKERDENPRWHYIMTLIGSPNESDWRVAVIEADTLLEETLKDKGFSGTTVSELLESARASGYANIQNAWDGHLIRNQITHQGSEFSLSQIEGRRVIKMFQNFFEELGIV